LETVLSGIKRRNVLLYRYCERVNKLAKTSDSKKIRELEKERTEFKQKAQSISNSMHPQIRRMMKSIDSMSGRILNDYVMLNRNIAYKKMKSVVCN
jgi:phage host-nuclease inhibitor protein Gam